MLNDEGGVEADVTVTRLDQDKFYVVTSIASLEHVIHWIRTGLEEAGFSGVELENVTTSFGVINVQGPQSKQFLQKFIPDLDIKFSRSLRTEVGGWEVMVVRLSYVGELGYELHVPAAGCSAVMDILLSSATPVQFAGAEAMESLAVEAGYRHWPEDLSQTDSPLEAGMAWVCSKTKQFRGEARLREREREGLTRRLVCLTLNTSTAPHTSDPILANGRTVGYIRRTQTGHTVGRDVCYGYAENCEDLKTSQWQVLSGGKLHEAEYHEGCPMS